MVVIKGVVRTQLKEIRRKKNLTHNQIANIIGIQRQSYTNIENGKRNPSLEVALKIKKCLGYEKDDLFDRSSSMS